jgi:hypothetical protein
MQFDDVGSVDLHTGEITSGNTCVVARIPISRFKREYLEIPEEIVSAMGAPLEKEPVFACDSRAQKDYVLDYTLTGGFWAVWANGSEIISPGQTSIS